MTGLMELLLLSYINNTKGTSKSPETNAMIIHHSVVFDIRNAPVRSPFENFDFVCNPRMNGMMPIGLQQSTVIRIDQTI